MHRVKAPTIASGPSSPFSTLPLMDTVSRFMSFQSCASSDLPCRRVLSLVPKNEAKRRGGINLSSCGCVVAKQTWSISDKIAGVAGSVRGVRPSISSLRFTVMSNSIRVWIDVTHADFCSKCHGTFSTG